MRSNVQDTFQPIKDDGLLCILGEERAWDFRARAGSTFAFSGSGRVGPRPVCGVKARAGSGFEYSSSGRVGPSPNYEVKALSFDWVNGMKLVIPFFQPKFDALKLLVKDVGEYPPCGDFGFWAVCAVEARAGSGFEHSSFGQVGPGPDPRNSGSNTPKSSKNVSGRARVGLGPRPVPPLLSTL